MQCEYNIGPPFNIDPFVYFVHIFCLFLQEPAFPGPFALKGSGRGFSRD